MQREKLDEKIFVIFINTTLFNPSELSLNHISQYHFRSDSIYPKDAVKKMA